MPSKVRVADRKSGQSQNAMAIAVVTGLITLLGVIYRGRVDLMIEQMKEAQEIRMYESQNEDKQLFYSKSDIVEMAGIEYVQYEFTSDPVVAGYHLLVYPYAICEKDDQKKYLPITGQFTQDEYVADENGYCRLLRENTTGDFLKMAASVVDFSIEVKYLVAIQYVKNGELKREVYDVMDGNLILSDPNIAMKVFKAWEDESSIKIDMWGWPCFDQKVLEGIFN